MKAANDDLYAAGPQRSRDVQRARILVRLHAHQAHKSADTLVAEFCDDFINADT